SGQRFCRRSASCSRPQAVHWRWVSVLVASMLEVAIIATVAEPRAGRAVRRAWPRAGGQPPSAGGRSEHDHAVPHGRHLTRIRVGVALIAAKDNHVPRRELPPLAARPQPERPP